MRRMSQADAAPTGRGPAYDLGGTVRDGAGRGDTRKGPRGRARDRHHAARQRHRARSRRRADVDRGAPARALADGCAGQGLDHALAQASALMESIEAHHAEHFSRAGIAARRSPPRPPTRATSIRCCCRCAQRARVSRPLASNGSRASSSTRDRELAFVPRECVDLDFARRGHDARLFVGSSNGLASGNTRAEAILHGLCEAIERDQTRSGTRRKQLEPTRPGDRLAARLGRRPRLPRARRALPRRRARRRRVVDRARTSACRRSRASSTTARPYVLPAAGCGLRLPSVPAHRALACAHRGAAEPV